jgi:T4-like virus Myoviridae tail sheath stabiliser
MAYEQHFYDAQVKRIIIQAIRLLSNFQVKFGDGTLVRVPVTYGDSSRQAASILARNSANRMPTTPQISVYITDFKYARERVQDPTFVDHVSVRTRKYDPVTNSYLNQQGNAYSVERLMPVPYTLTLKADIWTSNSDQKFQILEQILSLFNPALEIQSTDNYLDWASLSYMEQTNIVWSSRSIPQGTDDQIDISSVEFTIPIWLSSPARVTKMGVIQKVISSIYDSSGDVSDFVNSDDLLLGTRQAITFQNYSIWINNGQIQLLKNNPVNIVPSSTDIQAQVVVGETNDWAAALDKYGYIRNGISQLRLSLSPVDGFDTGSEIVGTISIHPTDSRILLYTVDIDTLPTNTLDPVTAIIDPQRVAPGINGLPAASNGQRYLLLNGTGNASDPQVAQGWSANGYETVAQVNDIIEYDGTQWVTVFDSSNYTTTAYISNIATQRQYKYSQGSWKKSWEGEYQPLNWRLVL